MKNLNKVYHADRFSPLIYSTETEQQLIDDLSKIPYDRADEVIDCIRYYPFGTVQLYAYFSQTVQFRQVANITWYSWRRTKYIEWFTARLNHVEQDYAICQRNFGDKKYAWCTLFPTRYEKYRSLKFCHTLKHYGICVPKDEVITSIVDIKYNIALIQTNCYPYKWLCSPLGAMSLPISLVIPTETVDEALSYLEIKVAPRKWEDVEPYWVATSLAQL